MGILEGLHEYGQYSRAEYELPKKGDAVEVSRSVLSRSALQFFSTYLHSYSTEHDTCNVFSAVATGLRCAVGASKGPLPCAPFARRGQMTLPPSG